MTLTIAGNASRDAAHLYVVDATTRRQLRQRKQPIRLQKIPTLSRSLKLDRAPATAGPQERNAINLTGVGRASSSGNKSGFQAEKKRT